MLNKKYRKFGKRRPFKMYLVPDKDRFNVAGTFVFFKELCDVYIKYSPMTAIIYGRKTKKYYFKERHSNIEKCKKALRTELVKLFNKVPCGGEQMASYYKFKKLTMKKVTTSDE